MSIKACYVTTSWDDGEIEDLRCVELLERYKLRGTFYVWPNLPEKRLSLDHLLYLAVTQEVGAHTISHPNLTRIPLTQAREEIVNSKDKLEKMLGRTVDMFCYPSGAHNQSVREIVQQAGFIGARTAQRFVTGEPRDLFQIGTSVRVFPHPYLPIAWGNILFALENNFQIIKNIWNLELPINSPLSWVAMMKGTFNYVLKHGGVWHLWGHSWEINNLGMWEQLDEVLNYVSGRDDVTYLTNGELVKRFKMREHLEKKIDGQL